MNFLIGRRRKVVENRILDLVTTALMVDNESPVYLEVPAMSPPSNGINSTS